LFIIYFLIVELWGLDEDGCFLTGETRTTNLFDIANCLERGKNFNVHQVVLVEFQKIIEQESKELDFMNSKSITDIEKQKRLLFLFQCDLMPGITGKIMSTKLERDLTKSRTVTLRAKIFCYCVVFVINISMLYYIFLFAINQTKYRQNAWFRSFLLWIVVEIVFVGSIVVLITHFAIPSIIMKDVYKIKERLLVNIREYQKKIRLKQVEDLSSTKVFNAAEHLFLSNRVSKHFQHLSISKLILQFTTPYPRQSYLHVRDVSKTYDRKFSEIGSSVVNILIFLLGSLLNIPIAMQDTIIFCCSFSFC
jgi:rRNA-processing protein FCF1